MKLKELASHSFVSYGGQSCMEKVYIVGDFYQLEVTFQVELLIFNLSVTV